MLKPEAKKPAVETLIVIVKDGLMLPSGFIAPSSYACNFFCRVPADWVEGEHIKENYLEKIYQKVYGETWRSGNSDGSRYVVQDAYSKVFAPETVKTTKWSGTVNDDKNHFWFYLVTENGEVKSVTAEEFQADIDAFFNPPPAVKENSYISSFEQGAVKTDTSLTPFFRAIAPLLENFAGSGEFNESFAPETGEKEVSDLFEDIASNSHGGYLKYQSYTLRRFGTEPPVEIKHIGSNLLQHVQTRERLLVNFTLNKEKETSQTKLIVRFVGRENVVEKLLNAVKPALEDCEFQVLMQMKEPPPPATLELLRAAETGSQ